MRLHEEPEKFRNRIDIPFLTLSLLLPIIIAITLVFTRDVYVGVPDSILILLPAVPAIILLLLKKKATTKQSIPIIPLIVAFLWGILSMLLLAPYPLSPNLILNAFLMYIVTSGIPIVILIHHNFWIGSGLDIHKINREFVLVFLLGGSFSIGFLLSSILRYNYSISQYELDRLLVYAAFAPIFEEILFRGAIQDILTKRLGSPLSAVAATSVLFGIYHLTSYSQTYSDSFTLFLVIMLVPVIGGVLYGIMRFLTDSTIPGIITHSMFNVIAVLGVDKAEGFLIGITIFVLTVVYIAIREKYNGDADFDEQNPEL